jgi:hypothetical protein
MNLISDVMRHKPECQISVFTSYNSSPYQNQKYSGAKIYRLGSVSKNRIARSFSYLIFNIIGLILLLLKRPDFVIVYESLSIFPAYIYSIIFPKKKIHVHFHEYVSLFEKKSASKYMNFLFKCENRILHKITISHTNIERKEMFLNDNSSLKSDKIQVYPNLPPKEWWFNFGIKKKQYFDDKIKMVYVGALDSESMYLDEIINLVTQNLEYLELTLYCQQISATAESILERYKSENIKIKSALNYYELPKELVQYDIGIVLYNGYNLNHIYSVPNKVFEYLYSGLPVIADKTLKSLEKAELEGVYLTNLSEIKLVNLKEIISKPFNFNDKHITEFDHLCNYIFGKK